MEWDACGEERGTLVDAALGMAEWQRVGRYSMVVVIGRWVQPMSADVRVHGLPA